MVRIAINGFGRIGRAAFKIALEQGDEAAVVAINDLGQLENLAYLLRYDTIYGRYGKDVAVAADALMVAGVRIPVFNEKDPAKLPWGDMNVDVVIESTGVFTDAAGAGGHITAGARRVVISAPADGEDVPTVVMGVNDAAAAGHAIVSNASCTTNCVTPVVAVLDKAFGIKKALLTTVHAYTASQSLVDGPAKGDLRRGRAAAANIVPSSTGAAAAATRAYAPLADMFDGVALRVPVPVVSISDLSLVLKKKVSAEDVNAALEDAADDPALKGVLGVTSDPVVSSDFIGDPRSAIVDLAMTRVVGGDLVKVMAWYDNEWGYSNRLVEEAILIGGTAGEEN
ncbi:MAG: type I glyceraldehyde-3-phosphate dehydrogenase [Candidatus Andersenbacteria bacterium CG10_big_fil_rev_8_21_14_0_10_54_11]|uniref:Type I glyceraldehyde-3-phosphate dehydrogenase n=1 Tax=Candidatus Andersenbacteria bacterium CG10_big_fil_rev_8_21_14_0_10_54_11 TaxID=1974485 RepID=A0A2M6WYV0_9BACT|nr:MAG: type I glyceraldehyde-3-phosphate dehydrogenase [Candidatus Andersenbacteria bacterium CG10_big_fil_rev_8_21_14_0_10_54_11]